MIGINRLKKSIFGIHHRSLSIQRAIMITTSIALVFTVFYEVVARYVFGKPFAGTEELLSIIVVWLYFISGGYATYERNHIKADMIRLLVKNPHTRNIIKLAVTSFNIAAAITICYYFYRYNIDVVSGGKFFIHTRIPHIFAEASLAVGATLMVIYFIMEVVDDSRVLREFSAKGQTPHTRN